jgi:hypothetical protein
MSYIDVLNDAAQRANEASTRAEDASELLEQIVNGPLDTYVPTLSGEVPTAATAIENLRSQISAGTLAPIAERVILAESQVNVTFNTVQTSGLALYVDEGEGGYRYFNFTVDGTSSVILGDTFFEGTELWGLSNEIGGEVGTAVQQTQANAQLAEDWAIKTDGTVDGTEFSSKYHAGEASASASAAATSEQNAALSESNASTSEQNAASSEANAQDYASSALVSRNVASSAATRAGVSENRAVSAELSAIAAKDSAQTFAGQSEAHALDAQGFASDAASSRDVVVDGQNQVSALLGAGIGTTYLEDGDLFINYVETVVDNVSISNDGRLEITYT